MITTGLVTFFVSTIVGAVFKLAATKIENNRAVEEAKLRALNAKAVVVDQARRYANKGFQVTRRFIAISATLSILVLPIVAPFIYTLMYPVDVIQAGVQPSVWFGYDVIKEGFWPFTSDSTVTEWKEMKGVVITPDHWNIMNSIIGMYFGTAIAKR
jgi:hypothetical protein